MNKKITVIVALVLLVVAIVFMVVEDRSAELDVEYINSTVLSNAAAMYGTEYVKTIHINEEINNDTLLLCSTENDNLMLLLLDKDKDLLTRSTIDVTKLTNNATADITTNVPLSNYNLHYNLFLNPTADTVAIGDRTVSVHVIELADKNATVGFWHYTE